MKVNPGLLISRDDTNLILMGKRDNLYIEETVKITNRFSLPIEVNLRECGIYDKIVSSRSFHKAVIKVLGYLNYNKMIDRRVYKDVRAIVTDSNYKSDVVKCVKAHIQLLHEDYDDIPGISFSPTREKIMLKIPTDKYIAARIIFMMVKRQYRTLLTISRTSKETANIVHWEKVPNAAALVKKFEYWKNSPTINKNNRILVDAVYNDIKQYFLHPPHAPALNVLIDHINDYTRQKTRKEP